MNHGDLKIFEKEKEEGKDRKPIPEPILLQVGPIQHYVSANYNSTRHPTIEPSGLA